MTKANSRRALANSANPAENAGLSDNEKVVATLIDTGKAISATLTTVGQLVKGMPITLKHKAYVSAQLACAADAARAIAAYILEAYLQIDGEETSLAEEAGDDVEEDLNND